MPTRAFVYNRQSDHRHTGPLSQDAADEAMQSLLEWHRGLVDPATFEIRWHVVCASCGWFPVEGANGRNSVPCPKCSSGVRA